MTPPAVGAGDDLVGGPVPWPPEVLDDVGPEAVAAALARAPEACGEAGRHLVDVDCSEYPCVAVFRLPFPSPVVLGSQQALCTVPAWTFGQVRGISPPGGEGSALVLVPLVGGSEAAAEGVAALRLAARLELLSQAFRWVHTEGAAP